MTGSPPLDGEVALIGLARRAGHVVIGTTAVLGAARAERLRAIIIARDASDNARKRLRAAMERVSTVTGPDRVSLGAALGRGPVAVVGVTDSGIASRLVSRLATVVSAAGTESAPAVHR